MNPRLLLPFILAAAIALPATAARLAGYHLHGPAAAILCGIAIIGASFLLLWACDAAQADISQSLAIAVVALIAVLPEYAVDMYFTWQAGQHPDQNYAHFAIANMTGANRLLIGVAWCLIAAIFAVRFRRAVRIEKDRRLELFFLGLTTLYAALIPLKGTLAWYDGIVFIGIYIWYITLASRRPCIESEAAGPAELLIHLPRARRRLATLALFLFSAGVILVNAQPFCEGLISTGHILRINEFVLVQWLAPIASEAPEFIVAIVFAWRGQGGLALGSLISSKLNQWTLLVGMIPGVFAISHGTLAHPLPMDSYQLQEITLTAAQSVLAVVLLASLRLSFSGALLLFALFLGQLLSPILAPRWPILYFNIPSDHIHPFFSILYITAAAAIFLQRPRRLIDLRLGLSNSSAPAPISLPNTPVEECENDDIHGPHCLECRWRRAGLKQPAHALSSNGPMSQ